MAASKHLGFRDAIAALYAAGTPLAGGRIDENRDFALPVGEASRIGVYRLQSVPERTLIGAAAPIDWVTDIRTVIKARKDVATSAETVADAIACDVYARVMADQTLGGLCDQIEPGIFAWDQDDADTNVVTVTWDCQVRHRTLNNTVS
jgi:hypothetical protein